MLRRTHTKLRLCSNRDFPHLLTCYYKRWYVDYDFPFAGKVKASFVCKNEFWCCTDERCKYHETIDENKTFDVWPDRFEWVKA